MIDPSRCKSALASSLIETMIEAVLEEIWRFGGVVDCGKFVLVLEACGIVSVVVVVVGEKLTFMVLLGLYVLVLEAWIVLVVVVVVGEKLTFMVFLGLKVGYSLRASLYS